MLLSTEYHAAEEAKTYSDAELEEAIETLENAPTWRGVDFDDARVRHKRAARLRVYREALAERNQ
jgi:hypothetical protein